MMKDDSNLISRILPTDFWLTSVAEKYGTQPTDGSSGEEEIRQHYLLEFAQAEKRQREGKGFHRRRLRRMQSQRAVQRLVMNFVEVFQHKRAA